MENRARQYTKLWLIPEFNNLEVFKAQAIHYHYARHSHPSYSIGIIEAGVGGNVYRGTHYLAPPKSIILMNPDEAHTGYSAEAYPLTYRMLYPSTELIQQIAEEMKMKGLPYFKAAVVQNQMLAHRLTSLHTILEHPHDSLEQQTCLVEVLSTLLQQYTDSHAGSDRSATEHRAVRLIKAYLHDNFSTPISLADLVKVTQLDRSYLIRVFGKAVGMPPYTYLNQVRVDHAKYLLRQGMAIAEVAIAVGMSDQSHLNRHFKSIVGVTPGHYRRMSISFKTEPP